MKKRVIYIVIVVLILTCLDLSGQESKTTPKDTALQRFAMLVGANDGGKERVKLKYAVSDAKAVSKIFEDMGGVAPKNRILLENPDRTTFFMELGRLKEKIRQAKAQSNRVEVIVYYSGHSDENHIFLGEEKVSYKDFKEAINSMDAEVRIAILDSCASGAFTRIKGGKKRKPFLINAANNMTGFAVMTSSSSDEVSQESDRIRGSFFTYYLLSGLRGAADMSMDGRVTLNEAYQFSFNETLAKTEKTMSGPQHPYYDIQMKGTGDVVMTDIRESQVLLVFDEDLSGKLFIHDEEDILVVELSKQRGRKIELGLEEGQYKVINLSEGLAYESNISLDKGKTVTLATESFKKTDQAFTTPRGSAQFRSQRQSMLKRRVTRHFFSRAEVKATIINDENAWLAGGNIGYTFNRKISFGFAWYGRAEGSQDINSELKTGKPNYMGITIGYAFKSHKKFHWATSLLLGSGNGANGQFFIVEPEIGIVLNFSKRFRLTAGIGIPITSKYKSGINSSTTSFGIQYGK
jgi:Caspase domain